MKGPYFRVTGGEIPVGALPTQPKPNKGYGWAMWPFKRAADSFDLKPYETFELLGDKSVVNLKKHIDLLGLKVRDRVTGITGFVTSINFDLYGCIQAAVHPGADKEGKAKEVCWYDVARLEVKEKKPVMAVPQFDFSPAAVSAGLKGSAEKPCAKA